MGVILYYLCTLRLPFVTDANTNAKSYIIKGQYTKIDSTAYNNELDLDYLIKNSL